MRITKPMSTFIAHVAVPTSNPIPNFGGAIAKLPQPLQNAVEALLKYIVATGGYFVFYYVLVGLRWLWDRLLKLGMKRRTAGAHV